MTNDLDDGAAYLSPRGSVLEICVSLDFYLQSHLVAVPALILA